MTENLRQSDSTHPRSPSPAEARQWLIAQLAAELEVSPDRIRIDQPIASYGVDSMQLVSMIARLEDWLGVRFTSNPLDDHPTIEALAQMVANQSGDDHSPIE